MGFGKSSTPNAYRFTSHELAVDAAALLDAALAAVLANGQGVRNYSRRDQLAAEVSWPQRCAPQSLRGFS
jgi:hypothetical protein